MTSFERRRFAITAGTVAALSLGYGATFVIAQAAAPREKVIRVSARRFEYSPSRLTLKKGVPVVLELTSEDVLMGLNIPDFNVRGDMEPGKVSRVRFVPDKTGSFVFLCDIFCGSGHERMLGTITVVD
jgi:cytochrome c oxidase subunit 2